MLSQAEATEGGSEPEREALRCVTQRVIARPLSNTRIPSSFDVVELTDSDSELDPVPAIVPRSPFSLTRKDKDQSSSATLTRSLDDDSSHEETVDFSRFAYSKPKSSIEPTSVPSSRSAPPLVEPEIESKSAKHVRRKAHYKIDGLSDNHLAKLTKCVSCDARWTTRKTVSQKMKHIQSCARKNGFTIETVQGAVLKEIKEINMAKAAAANSPTEKENGAGASEASPTTLLATTMNAVAGRKKPRRRMRETVERVGVRRKAILERAKEILAHSPPAKEVPGASKTDTMEHDDESPPATQSFGQSVLQSRCVSKTNLFAAASTGEPLSIISHTLSIEPGDNRPHAGNAHPGTKGYRHEMRENEIWDRPKGDPTSGHITGGDDLEEETGSSDVDLGSCENDEQWMQQFKALILQDRDLHLSILRYEPIQFDRFKRLAEVHDLKTVKLTASLKAFLDKEAIHYHGVESHGVRKRR